MRTLIFWISFAILGVLTMYFLAAKNIVSSGVIVMDREGSHILQWPLIGILLFLGGIVLSVQIAELKAKKLNERRQSDSKYNKKVLTFEKMSENLKIKGSDETRTSIWISLKHRLTHNMEDLGHVLGILH